MYLTLFGITIKHTVWHWCDRFAEPEGDVFPWFNNNFKTDGNEDFNDGSDTDQQYTGFHPSRLGLDNNGYPYPIGVDSNDNDNELENSNDNQLGNRDDSQLQLLGNWHNFNVQFGDDGSGGLDNGLTNGLDAGLDGLNEGLDSKPIDGFDVKEPNSEESDKMVIPEQ